MIASDQKMSNVRLSSEEKDSIIEVINQMSDNLSLTCVEISLFGSRVNLKSKGGDIDLFLKFSSEKDIDSLHLKRKLKIALKDKLGDQKIDIIIDDSNTDLGAIGKVISRDKVALWLKK